MTYSKMLSDLGFDAATVEMQSARTDNRIDIDLDEVGVYLATSKIHGIGVFAGKDVEAGGIIGPASLEAMRTQIGRYLNHSDAPNCHPIRIGNGVILISNFDIRKDEEITTNYREMVAANGVRPEDQEKRILEFERLLAEHRQAEVEPTHHFADGLYSRTILIPANHWITGRVHKQNDFNVVSYGKMRVMGDGLVRDVIGPCQFPGRAGVKQLGFAFEDTLWTTIHHTHETNLDAIEKELFMDPHGINVLDFKTGKMVQGVLS